MTILPVFTKGTNKRKNDWGFIDHSARRGNWKIAMAGFVIGFSLVVILGTYLFLQNNTAGAEAYSERVEILNLQAVRLTELSEGLVDTWAMKIVSTRTGFATMTVQPHRLKENFAFIRVRSMVYGDSDFRPVLITGGGHDRPLPTALPHVFSGPGITEVDRFFIEFYMWSDPWLFIEVCDKFNDCESLEFTFYSGMPGGESLAYMDLSMPYSIGGYQLYEYGFGAFNFQSVNRCGAPFTWGGLSTSYVAAMYPD